MADKSTAGRTGICVVSRSLDSEDLLDEPSLCMTALATRLAAAGHVVTLLWILQAPRDDKEIQRTREHYKARFGIELVHFEHSNLLIWRFANAQHYSFGLDAYIRRQNFSDVFIPLEGGLAYYPLLSKETGVFEPETAIHVVASAPMDWCSEVDRFFFSSLEQVRISFMERYCAMQADRLVCTSTSLQRWMLSKGWKLSRVSEVLSPLSPPEWEAGIIRDESPSRNDEVELVPLIGSRYRDGIALFCDTLDKLGATLDQNVKVTLVGQFFGVLGEHSAGMYLRRGRRWPHALRFARGLSLHEGVHYARQAGAIAVIPNYENGGGYFVRECIRLGVPFVATSVGGNADEVHCDYAKASLCAPDAQALASLIAEKSRNRTIALPSQTEGEKLLKWSAPLGRKAEAARSRRGSNTNEKDRKPLVSVIVVHHDRPQYLLQAISSIVEQDYERIEVVLVDDGSKLPESQTMLDRLQDQFERREWKIIRAENRYVGAARNAGVRASKGEFIIFADDDNALLPGAISKYVSAILRSEADVCTALCKNFYGANVPGSPHFNFVGYIPLGGALDASLVESCFGDTMSIYRRTVFDKVGYQLEKFGYMVEDYEFFVRICLAGLKLRVIPEPLFLYRISTQGRYRSSHYHDNHLPILRAFANAKFAGLDGIYSLVIGQNISEYEKNSFRTNLGYSPSDRELLRLCDMDPNEEQAIRLLAKIAAGESRPETAIGLISSLDGNKVVEEIAAISKLTSVSWEALRATRSSGMSERALGIDELRTIETHSTAGTDIIPMSYVEEPARLFIEAKDGFASVAVLPAGCPAATSAVTCDISLPESELDEAEFLLLLCPMHDDVLVRVGEDHAAPSQGASGWTRVVGSRSARLEVRLSVPAAQPANLVVAVRGADGSRKRILGCIESVRIRVSLEDRSDRRPRLGAPAHRLRARNWTNDERMHAKLAQGYPSTLPSLLFPKEHAGGIFLRPAKAGPVVAVLKEAFPSFARRLLAQVEVAHDEAPPIEFALALTLPANKVEWRTDGPRAPVAFSGWVRVEEKFKLQDISLRLLDQLPIALTINMAVRLPRGSDPGPTNAFFRNLKFLWDE